MSTALLARHPITLTDDPVDMLASLRRTFRSDVKLLDSPEPTGPYEIRGVASRNHTIGLVSSGLAVRVQGGRLESSYFINVGVKGQVCSSRRQERMVNQPGLVAVYGPGDSMELIPADPGTETLGIRVDRDLVEEELRKLIGRPLNGPVVFGFTIDLATPQTSGLALQLNSTLALLASASELFDHPSIQDGLVRSLVTGVLLTHDNSYTDSIHRGHAPLRPRHLRRALEFIDANLGEPVTLGDIAQAAGCSARTLTEAFRSHLNVSPMTHLRHCRLEAVRADLLAHTGSISEVALRYGFGHLGRFSSFYRQRFDELPSQTLQHA